MPWPPSRASGCSWARRRPPDALACAAGRRAGGRDGRARRRCGRRGAACGGHHRQCLLVRVLQPVHVVPLPGQHDRKRIPPAAGRRSSARRSAALARPHQRRGRTTARVGCRHVLRHRQLPHRPDARECRAHRADRRPRRRLGLHAARGDGAGARGSWPLAAAAGCAVEIGSHRTRDRSDGAAGWSLCSTRPPATTSCIRSGRAGASATARWPSSWPPTTAQPGGRPVTRSRLRNLRRHRPPARSDAGHRGRAAHHRCGARDVVRSAASGYPRVTSHRRS